MPRQPRTMVQGKISRQQLLVGRQRKSPGRGTKVLIPEKETESKSFRSQENSFEERTISQETSRK